MKVLFAVNNESISESIIKKYQKEYKEIISFKNVYYFNAILKEIQKDKSYDRIVIGEDLEQFTNSSYEQMDKFIFERLDSISDEASNVQGNDIPIILICNDRRNKGEQILVKLFGIGIYNAIIGTDRSVDEVCRLIYKPRVKKDAKLYYRIDSDDVAYQAENENDVSEVEIQNILAHYKRLGRQEERYVESFDNIASQYNEKQLRVICKFLPLNVKAVLEEQSPRYQKVMSFNNSVSNQIRKSDKEMKKNEGITGKMLTSNSKGGLTKPVVIPSSIDAKNVTKLTKNVAKTQNISNIPVEPKIEFEEFENLNSYVDQPLEEQPNTVEEPVQAPKRGRGRPRKNAINEEQDETIQQTPKRGRGRPRKNPTPVEPEIEENSILLGLDDNKDEYADISNLNTNNSGILPGFNDEEDEDDEYTDFGNLDTNNSGILPGFNDEEDEDDEYTDFSNLDTNNSGILPGFNDEEDEDDEDADFGNIDTNNSSMLPGFDDEEDEEEYTEFNNINANNNNVQKTENEAINVQEDNLSYSNYNNSNSFNSVNNNFSNMYGNNKMSSNDNNSYITESNVANLLTGDKKLVTFVGTTKNGTSFVINNIAQLLASMGINTAILDTTSNRNSYYIYTQNEEELRKTAFSSIESLVQGRPNGIKVNSNLTVYTSLPDENDTIRNSGPILESLVKNHTVVLIDCDFETPQEYFRNSQEIYLVQSMDVLTIQPLTAFLRDLKAKDILDEKKIRIIINKFTKVRTVTEKTIIGGMAFYNDPAMSYMTELFDRNMVKYVTLPFEEETYTRYLEALVNCEISLKGYSKTFIQYLKQVANMVYPLVSGKGTYKPPRSNYNSNGFSSSMNNTLNQMKQNY